MSTNKVRKEIKFKNPNCSEGLAGYSNKCKIKGQENEEGKTKWRMKDVTERVLDENPPFNKKHWKERIITLKLLNWFLELLEFNIFDFACQVIDRISFTSIVFF